MGFPGRLRGFGRCCAALLAWLLGLIALPAIGPELPSTDDQVVAPVPAANDELPAQRLVVLIAHRPQAPPAGLEDAAAASSFSQLPAGALRARGLVFAIVATYDYDGTRVQIQGYVGTSDPVNRWDPSGLWAISADRSFAVAEPGDTIQTLYDDLGGQAGTGRPFPEFNLSLQTINADNGALFGAQPDAAVPANTVADLSTDAGATVFNTPSPLLLAIQDDNRLQVGEILELSFRANEVNAILGSQDVFVTRTPNNLTGSNVEDFGDDLPGFLTQENRNRLIAASVNQRTARKVLTFRDKAFADLVTASFQFARVLNPPQFVAEKGFAIGSGVEPVLGVEVDRADAARDLVLFLALVKGGQFVSQKVGQLRPNAPLAGGAREAFLGSVFNEARGSGFSVEQVAFRGVAGRGRERALQAFEQGLAPRGGAQAQPSVQNLVESINVGSRNSAFVQASESADVALGFATSGGTRGGVVFEVAPRFDAIFVNRTPLRGRIDFPDQRIVAFPGGIRSEQILRAFIVDKNGSIIDVIVNPALAP